jgi:hypothetical protein
MYWRVFLERSLVAVQDILLFEPGAVGDKNNAQFSAFEETLTA